MLWWFRLYADDFLIICDGRQVQAVLSMFVFVLAILGVPLSLPKLRVGKRVTWIGYEIDVSTGEIGITDSRRAWLQEWVNSKLRARVVSIREFQGGLGRLGFAAGALTFLRPFLGPRCLAAFWGTAHKRPNTWTMAAQTALADGARVRHVAGGRHHY